MLLENIKTKHKHITTKLGWAQGRRAHNRDPYRSTPIWIGEDPYEKQEGIKNPPPGLQTTKIFSTH